MTDGNGSVSINYAYNAFGNQESGQENDNNPFRYCGEYFDSETGFIYLRARYYNTEAGRFTTEDDYWNTTNMIYGDNNIGVPNINAIMQSSNLYVYCGNNPIMWADPSGKVVTEWDRNVMHQSQIDRIQWITDNWNSGTAEQQKAWREEAERYRAMWRNEYEFTDLSGITRSTITGGEIKFRNTSQQLGTGILYIKVGYSKNTQGKVVLSPKNYRQSAYIISTGIGVKYETETQYFATDGNSISWEVTYSKTITFTIPFTPWEHSFTSEGGHSYGTLYNL